MKTNATRFVWLKLLCVLLLTRLIPLELIAQQADVHATANGNAGSNEEEAKMRQVAEAWKNAYNAKDAARVAALYSQDACYLSAHVMARGRPAIQAYFQRGIDAGGHIDTIHVLISAHSGDLGYSVCIYDATNAGRKVSGRNIVVMKRVAGVWLIAAHESVVPDQP